jgi:hypothetical protein
MQCADFHGSLAVRLRLCIGPEQHGISHGFFESKAAQVISQFAPGVWTGPHARQHGIEDFRLQLRTEIGHGAVKITIRKDGNLSQAKEDHGNGIAIIRLYLIKPIITLAFTRPFRKWENTIAILQPGPITAEKIERYKKFNGDLDSWVRSQLKDKDETLSGPDWTLIDKAIQRLKIEKKGYASNEYRTETERVLAKTFDGPETVQLAKAMV